MSKGIVLFANNNGITDYYKMAAYTAKRVNRFYDLPVTVITDSKSITNIDYTFDKTIILDPPPSNFKNKSSWINKGRYKVYDLTPYDDTLVLDTDYMINSRELLKTFDQPSDFMCYQSSKYLLQSTENERMSENGLSIYWATVLRFRKSNRVNDLFRIIESVQHNYQHYADLHRFLPYTYRNDYALTIALRTVNGHVAPSEDFINGRLIHAGEQLKVERIDDTTYNISSDITINGRIKRQYIKLKDFDFHMLDKSNFMEIAV